jgi:hypothetical protein
MKNQIFKSLNEKSIDFDYLLMNEYLSQNNNNNNNNKF